MNKTINYSRLQALIRFRTQQNNLARKRAGEIIMAWSHQALAEHPKHAVEVANIIANWNTAEDMACRYLELFFALDMGAARALTSQIQSSRGKIDFIAESGRNFIKNDMALLAEFESVIKILEKRLRQRNMYAHALYVTNTEEPGSLYRANRTENPFDTEGYTKISFDELRTQRNLMVDAFNTTSRFHMTLRDRTPKALRNALEKVQLVKLVMAGGHDPEDFNFQK